MTPLLSVQDERVNHLRARGCNPFQILSWYTFEGEERSEKLSVEKLVSRPLRWTETELCPLTRYHAEILADHFGIRLPTRDEALSFRKFPHMPIQTLAWNDPKFSTVEGAKLVTARIDVARPSPGIIDNESKMWIDGASPGWALLVGFFNSAGLPANTGTGNPGKPGYGPKGEPHNDRHVDYSMAPPFVWE